MKWVALAVALLACHLSSRVALAAHNRNEVPFKLYRGYAIVVHGSIGSMKNLNFLIDTGAVPSILDRRIAEKLDLIGTTEKLSVFTQELKTERVSAQNVDMGPFHADTLPAVVRDLSFAEEALGTRVDALIGFDLLNRSAFTIDYQSKKITIGPIAPSLAVIPYHAGPGYVVVEMKLQQKMILLLVDTGASNLVLFESGMRDCADAIIPIGSRTWSNTGGTVKVKQVQLKNAYLGTIPWGSQDAFILASASGYVPHGLSGLLGVTSLKVRRIGFDPDRMVLVLNPSEHASTIAESPSSLQRGIGHRVDGIVGLDVPRKSSFTIDYKTRERLFGTIEKLAFSAPFETEMPVVTMAARVQNQNLRLVVDPGSPDMMLFQSRMPGLTFEELGSQAVADGSLPRVVFP